MDYLLAPFVAFVGALTAAALTRKDTVAIGHRLLAGAFGPAVGLGGLSPFFSPGAWLVDRPRRSRRSGGQGSWSRARRRRCIFAGPLPSRCKPAP